MAEPELGARRYAWQAVVGKTFPRRILWAPQSAFLSAMLGAAWAQATVAAIVWLDGWAVVLVSLAVLGLVTALWISLTAFNTPPVDVDLECDLLRIGSRIVPLSGVNRAAVLVTRSDKRGRTYGIRFGKDKARMATVMLRVNEKIVLDAQRSALLATALERSEIRMPQDGNDSTGRFARYNFPNNLDRAAAVSLVRDPLARDQQLPIAGFDRYPQR